MTTTPTLNDRARAGAAVLDANRPGWESSVNAETLNLVSVFSCVLGQVFGEYTEGARSLGIEPWGHESADLGFRIMDGANGDPSDDGDPERNLWAELTDAWREVLAERLVAA